MEPMCDGRPTRNSGLLHALARALPSAGCFRPEPAGLLRLQLLAGSAHPDPDRWDHRRHLSPCSFRIRTRLAGNELSRRRGGYDIVLQFQTLFAPGSPLPPEPYAVFTDNTFSLTERCYPPWNPLSRRGSGEFWRLEQHTFEHAAITFAKSDFVRAGIVEDYGVPPEKVVTVGGGANSLRGELSDDPARYASGRALFVGYEFERKGGATLLAAWEEVRRRLPDAELVIAGPKPGRSANGVRWLGPIRDKQAVERLYDEAAVFVMPSLFEPFGNVFFEAMGRGLPCIGTTVGGLPEVIRDGRSGLMVPPGDPDALAQALVSLLSDPQAAMRFGREAYEQVRLHHRWELVGATVAEHLARVARATEGS
jgi:glycosyltransferase involved in cell wall biosynthesis